MPRMSRFIVAPLSVAYGRPLAMALLLSLAATTALAQEPPSAAPADQADAAEASGPPWASAISTAYEESRYSDALRLTRQAVKTRPDNPLALFWHGELLRILEELEPAREALEKAETLDPTDPDIPSTLAAVYLGLARFKEARGAIDRALALDDSHPHAQEHDRTLSMLERLQSGQKSIPTAGAPESFVHSFLMRIEASGLPTAVREYVAPATLAKMMRGLGKPKPSSRDIDHFLSGMQEGVRKVAGASTAYYGFEVQAAESNEQRTENTLVIPVAILTKERYAPDEVAVMRKMFADPMLHPRIEPGLLDVLKGLNPEDRARYFTQLSHHTGLINRTLNVEISRISDQKWEITDIFDQTVRMSELGAVISTFADKGLIKKPTKRKSVAARVTKMVISALLGFLFIAVIRWLYLKCWSLFKRE